ncbi:MAG TPA: hypothetical protein VM290_05680 [Gaiellaceae bacterium]|nr:hypothetical protein [Gaiellaceae bacterium]
MTTVLREPIRIETSSRWDALDLLARIPGLRAYLVQLGDRRWNVCVRPDGDADDVLAALLPTAQQWATERAVEAVVRVGERRYELRR